MTSPFLKINCDIGERGPDNPVDIALMKHIQIANIACGGHAGDLETIAVFRELALKNDIEVSAHLSYPNPDNFGRISMDIPFAELRASLEEQLDNMPDMRTIKFHGALYNDSCVDPGLALSLSEWLSTRGIIRIICPGQSAIAESCEKVGIEVMAEAFAERRYAYLPATKSLALTSRKKEYAVIEDMAQAVEQSVMISDSHRVVAILEKDDGKIVRRMTPLLADTICIHSDSDIALELAIELNKIFSPEAERPLLDIEVLTNGIFTIVGGPEYGRQDLGYSPGGPQDRFSMVCGNILLENPHYETAIELVYPPEIKFHQDTLFTLTGAKFDQVTLTHNSLEQPIEHATVYNAEKEDRLCFGKGKRGFRAYLCTKPYSENSSHLIGRSRGPFNEICSWADNSIRLIKGPEYEWLDNPDEFFTKEWTTSTDMNNMGIRIDSEGDALIAQSYDLVSSAVADGTVQLTPTGPIILMRGRQTTGGYPRIFNVISADIDMLAQYSPGQRVPFKLIEIEEAREIMKKWQTDLERFELSSKE